MMIKLKEYIIVTYDNSYIYFIYRTKVTVKRCNQTIEITKKLIEGTYLEEIEGIDKDIALQLKTVLSSHNMISEYNKSIINGIEERFIYYLDQFNGDPMEKYKNLGKRRVCIIGLGGIGGNILQVLASSGVKNYILIDFDRVELSNLNRQFLYNIHDIGSYKTKVCYDKLMGMDPLINCITFNTKITFENELMEILDPYKIDIIVCGADTPISIRKIVEGVAFSKKCAYCYGGLGIDYGIYALLPYNKCTLLKEEMNDKQCLNRKIPKGSFGASNAIISDFMSFDIINYLLSESVWCGYNEIFFDFKRMKMTVLKR